jgi:hypothetical protein
MAISGFKFVQLPEELQKRVIRVMKKIESHEIDPDVGGEFFMNYFAQRLGIIADNHPNSALFHQAAKGQHLVLIIKGCIDYSAVFGDKITEFTAQRGSKPSDPAMIFNDMDTFLDVILNKKDLMRAGVEKKVEVRKMAPLFKWMAPIMAANDEKTQQLLEEKCPKLLEAAIAEIEARTGIE